jgi:peptidyl-prolyl cis-trans isomerase C
MQESAMSKSHIMKATFFAAAIAFPSWAQDITADTVVATVDGTDITIGHMIILLDELPDQYKNLPDDVLFDGIKEQLIQQTVLAKAYDGPDYAIGIRLENEERTLKAGSAINLAVQERVNDAALQALYEERFANADPQEEYNASHILVETEQEAIDLIAELQAGADFAALAQEHSTGPSGPNGGQLGWFGVGMMVPPFEEAVIAMQPETISAPVQTQFGWHVIRLNEKRVLGVPTLDDVRADLADELNQLAIEAEISELMENAAVDEVDTSAIDPSVLRNLDLVLK